MANIRIGTSGWYYKHWRGRFYAPDCHPETFLSLYAAHFDTVEINSTFYRLPDKVTLRRWRDGTPSRFEFSCKASRYITHMKKLKEPEKILAPFFETIGELQLKLGPVLFQLPPGWRCNMDRFTSFLCALPPDHRYAFEFRNETWHTPQILRLLEKRNAAFCVFDLKGRACPIEITADLAYIRLHGPTGPYKGQYTRKGLERWAKRLLDWKAEGRDVYCFFDNEELGYAVQDATRLTKMVA